MPGPSGLLRRVSLLLIFATGATTPITAISPYAVMFYGGRMATPVIQRCSVQDNVCASLWDVRRGGYDYAVRRSVPLPSGLEHRAYVNVAIFWGLHDLDRARPEDASQHARFYPGTSTEQAVVVATPPAMQGPNGTRPAGMPAPSDLDAFVSGWTLETWETTPFDAALRGTAEGRRALPQAAR